MRNYDFSYGMRTFYNNSDEPLSGPGQTQEPNWKELAREILDSARPALRFQQAVHFSSSPKSEPITRPAFIRQSTRDFASRF